MRSRPAPEPVEDDLFRQELINIINMRHELVRLAALIDWSVFDRQFEPPRDSWRLFCVSQAEMACSAN
jgi:IS5 family transposase